MKEIIVGIWLTLRTWKTRMYLKGFKYLFEKEKKKEYFNKKINRIRSKWKE